jgi:hypothetical protein
MREKRMKRLADALAAGLFRANGVEVRLVPFSGQLERDTAAAWA